MLDPPGMRKNPAFPSPAIQVLDFAVWVVESRPFHTSAFPGGAVGRRDEHTNQAAILTSRHPDRALREVWTT